jgi:hypothetical protein
MSRDARRSTQLPGRKCQKTLENLLAIEADSSDITAVRSREAA